jgi:hypothetical protein
MEQAMTTLQHRRLSNDSLNDFVQPLDLEPFVFSGEHRLRIAENFRRIPSVEHRRLTAWDVEVGAARGTAFAWTPANARRVIGNAGLRRVVSDRAPTCLIGIHDEVDELLLRAATGYARPGSLPHWLSSLHHAARGLVIAEAMTWASVALDALRDIAEPWLVPETDAYYDVAAARTSLRGRRDVIVASSNQQRIVVRIRSGLPTKSSGTGLRSDLAIDGLARPDGAVAQRIVGLWPDAGLVMAVDGTEINVRAGVRSLVRAAVAQQRKSHREVA